MYRKTNKLCTKDSSAVAVNIFGIFMILFYLKSTKIYKLLISLYTIWKWFGCKSLQNELDGLPASCTDNVNIFLLHIDIVFVHVYQ